MNPTSKRTYHRACGNCAAAKRSCEGVHGNLACKRCTKIGKASTCEVLPDRRTKQYLAMRTRNKNIRAEIRSQYADVDDAQSMNVQAKHNSPIYGEDFYDQTSSTNSTPEATLESTLFPSIGIDSSHITSEITPEISVVQSINSSRNSRSSSTDHDQTHIETRRGRTRNGVTSKSLQSAQNSKLDIASSRFVGVSIETTPAPTYNTFPSSHSATVTGSDHVDLVSTVDEFIRPVAAESIRSIVPSSIAHPTNVSNSHLPSNIPGEHTSLPSPSSGAMASMLYSAPLDTFSYLKSSQDSSFHLYPETKSGYSSPSYISMASDPFSLSTSLSTASFVPGKVTSNGASRDPSDYSQVDNFSCGSSVMEIYPSCNPYYDEFVTDSRMFGLSYQPARSRSPSFFDVINDLEH